MNVVDVARQVMRRVRRAVRSSRSRTADASSFGALIDEREAWLHEHLPAEAARYHAELTTKLEQRAMAERLGLPLAHAYLAGVTLAAVREYVEVHGLDRFVIKPNSSRSSIGCCVLVDDRTRVRDLRTLRRDSMRRHFERARRAHAKLRRADEWLLEEVLTPPDGSDRLCDDIKIYCMGGRAELIVHKRHAVGRKSDDQIFTPEWVPVNTGVADRNEFRYDTPERGDEAVALAERAARSLCYPFIRIDMYVTDRGIVLGELTPGPGRRYLFNDEWNRYMVRRWHEAANEIVDGIASGRITPLGPPHPTDAPTPGTSRADEPAPQNRPMATTQSER